MITQARRDVGLDTIFLVVECNDDPDYYTSLGSFGDGSIIESHFGPYTAPNGTVADNAVAFKGAYQARWGGLPTMMGATTYEGVYIAANAVEQAGTLDKAEVRAALAATRMPEFIQSMQGGMISFSPDAREAQFNLYMAQLAWNDTAKTLRPTIVWPSDLQQADFVLPDWYRPGPP